VSAAGRRRNVDAAYVAKRAETARTFHEVAALAVAEDTWHQAAAALYVLAGIAAADAICGKVLGQVSRGQDHRQATAMLHGIRDAEKAEAALTSLLAIKDDAHYSFAVTVRDLKRAERAASILLAEMES
jgi:hypothetical protein